MPEWTDKLARARIQVDKEFYESIERSQFTEQEWGLIMRATEWRVANPESPEHAKLVAETDKVAEILPQLSRIRQDVQTAAAGPEAARQRTLAEGFSGWINGFVEMLSRAVTSNSRDSRVEDAEALAAEYAERVQDYLERRGKWNEVRKAAAEEQAAPASQAA
jgi:hypothetical protein